MTCDEARAALLAGVETPAVASHLARCRPCRRTAPAFTGARRRLADPALWEEPPAGLEDRVVARIVGHRAPDTDTAAPAGRRRRHLEIAAVAAAVVLLAAALLAGRTPAPDWQVVVPGTGTAPGARAVVSGWSIPGGTRVRLEVTGLPPAPAGHLYELWFSRAGDHVPAGTFRTAGRVAFTVAVARRDFPRIWVTVEPVGYPEGPEGPVLLDTGPS